MTIPEPGSELESSPELQLWCDVGGTFTDAFVVDAHGRRRAGKVLSSGLTKGHVERIEDYRSVIDPLRAREPHHFWCGATFHALDERGQRVWQSTCVEHDAGCGRLRLADALPLAWVASAEKSLIGYELSAGLEAPVLAARLLLGVPLQENLPPLSMRLGTTRGTNALLTRTGTRVALITTRGFRDILHIGYQERPELFALRIVKRQPLFEEVEEVDERMGADGSVLQRLELGQVHELLGRLRSRGIQSLAIALLHGYQYPQHEALIERAAKEFGFDFVSRSSRLAPMIKLVSRSETTVIDAYLGPVVRSYLEQVARQAGMVGSASGRLQVMTSSGGLVSYPNFQGKDSVLSGPAGGVVAVSKLAAAAGARQVLGLDMGGTSTDVCRIEGQPTVEYESVKAGVRLMTPMLAVHTVAAGGGSICRYDGVQWHVGPASAGSDPGPACYGRGGPLTVTDLNLLLGRLVPEAFPFSLKRSAALSRLDELLQQAGLPCTDQQRETMAQGLRRIANEHMAAAVRRISLAQGADPRQHVLIGFGGAAGQHLGEIADILQIETILDPPDAGLLSALGMGLADIQRWHAQGLYRPLMALSEGELEEAFLALEAAGTAELASEGHSGERMRHRRWVELRYAGADQPLQLPWPAGGRVKELVLEGFHQRHRERFGYVRAGHPLEVMAVRVETRWETTLAWDSLERRPAPQRRQRLSTTRLYSAGQWREGWSTPRAALPPGTRLAGPGIVLSSGHTTVLDQGWALEVLSDGTLRCTREETHHGSWNARRAAISTEAASAVPTAVAMAASNDGGVDPILREVLAQRMAAIAESMGLVLEQTALSVNIKERRDFSCAVFSCQGELIANAPHVPVHLGAMSETVKHLLRLFPAMRFGDSFITNDPYHGGSHLPDVTVISPVFAPSGQLWFFVANRAHHAEIGGLAPGSMSPATRHLEEEGAILSPMYLTRGGESCLADVERQLTEARYPTRALSENLADLAAQQAANRRGQAMLLELVEEYPWPLVDAYLEHILAASEAKVRRWIAGKLGQQLRFVDRMDDGTPIQVQLDFSDEGLRIDFHGTGPVSPGNFNANPAIVTAAVLYVLRTVIQDDLPLNSGVLRPVRLEIPPGLLQPYQPHLALPRQPAVAAGNVETSQRVVDCLLGALGGAAASQGTMNNLLLGNPGFGYYETVGGGSGATPDGPGSDAVHTHMTNTRLTDPEVLESRYPLRLTRFEIRRDSGGQGRMAGGHGMHRELEFLEDLEVSLVTSRRATPPYGAAGGEPGAAGENYRIDRQGRYHALPSVCQLRVVAGERIGMLTPGGGGYGRADVGGAGTDQTPPEAK
jgi:5-oxoprolinase (ATP-hydrolysing)